MCSINYYYENCEKENSDYDRKLFYAIMYRQWLSVVNLVKIIRESKNENWSSIKGKKFSDTDITIDKCFRFNMDFLKSNKNQVFYEQLCEQLGEEFKNLENDFDFFTYDDNRFSDEKSVLEIFWNGNQPVLDLKYYEKQTLAAKQVMKNKCSMVLDEVGTGKTVAGIYTIQQIIQEHLDHEKSNPKFEPVKILIICPYNKREDWHNDILRQLGLESTVIDQSVDGSALKQRSIIKKRASIYISGNKGGNDDGNSQQLKSSFLENWDLVIIDECHSCFDSYARVKSKRALLLTATPIVVSSEGIRKFDRYEERLKNILQDKRINEINPIENQNPTENDIFVCNFKEDIFENIEIKRKIHFIECERVAQRNDWFNQLRYGKNFFSAIFADQDDESLSKKMSENFPNMSYPLKENYKLNTLINIIMGEKNLNDKETEEGIEIEYCQYRNDSFIVFCETIAIVDLIYERLSGYATDKLMIGKLHGDVAEIKNHQTNKTTILQTLKSNIRNDKRSVLITTGKSGGTGINLGEFSTVIHYELPFSSNEIEQRFGRIERADDFISIKTENGVRKSIENKMIFLINQVKEGELDFINNRMLYYAINKINITVSYMPIRNTVLFNPEYMGRVKKNAKDVCNYILNKLDQEQNQINALFLYLEKSKEARKTIQEILANDKSYLSKGILEDIHYILNNTNADFINEDSKNILNKYHADYSTSANNFENQVEGLKQLIEYYLFLKRTLSFWGVKIGTFDEEQHNYEINDEPSDNSFDEPCDDMNSNSDERLKDESSKMEKNIKDIIDSLIINDDRCQSIEKNFMKIRRVLDEDTSLNTYSGVFYIQDGKMTNKTFARTGVMKNG